MTVERHDKHTARHDLEVGKLLIQSNRATAAAGLLLAVAPDLVDPLLQLGDYGVELRQFAEERVLGTVWILLRYHSI